MIKEDILYLHDKNYIFIFWDTHRGKVFRDDCTEFVSLFSYIQGSLQAKPSLFFSLIIL